MKNDYDIFSGSDSDRVKFVNTLIPGMKKDIYSKSVIEQFFEIEEYEDGDIISHSKDADIPAISIDGHGSTDIYKRGDKYFPPRCTITDLCEIPMVEVAARQYNVLEKLYDKIVSNFVKIDKLRFDILLDTSANYHHNITKYGLLRKFIGCFRRGYLITVVGNILQKMNRKYKMGYMVCSPTAACKFRTLLYKYGTDETIEEFKRGSFFGLKIVTFFDCDGVYFLPKDKIGYKDVAKPLFAHGADGFLRGKASYGFLFIEISSMSVDKTDSIYKLVI